MILLEQQPQLFVTESFAKLTDILLEFEKTMLFKSIGSNDNQNHLKEDKAKITKLNNSNINSTDEEISKLYYMFFNGKIEPKDLKRNLIKNIQMSGY